MYEAEFPLDDSIIYLNHAAVSPWPQRTANAVKRFADENVAFGSQNYLHWVATENTLKQQLQRLVNAESSDEIALLKNTSEALSVVAYGLTWQQGDCVVITDQEFPSNRVVWESLKKHGVTTRIATVTGSESPETAIIETLDDSTRILSVSAVQFGTGLKLDLAVLGKACRERGILFCIDAIQGIGAVDFDVQASHADFVMADAHKWMMGPEGIALFYCRKAMMEQLDLKQYGWHMLEDSSNYDSHEWEVAHSARRFECGSPNMTGVQALHASMTLIEEVGMPLIEQLVLENSRFMIDYFLQRADRYQLITPEPDNRHAGIITVRPLNESTESLFKMLASRHVMCALRGGGIRFSPHFYTPRKRLFSALEILDS
jgi:selenocysteine lyase/cysteine desulfurase